MTRRLKIIASHLGGGELFADIGCDHGLISKYVLDNGLFNKVIASDISCKSLEKARALLSFYGDKVSFLVSDGFKNFSALPDEAVIAGMGGEEICSILLGSEALPDRLILSPQKNVVKVRELLIRKNYKITDDYTVFDKKFYEIIVAEKGKDFLTEEELKFGRTNLEKMPADFIAKLKLERIKLEKILSENKVSDYEKISYLNKIKEILNEDKQST